jgi:hypothetical protein
MRVHEITFACVWITTLVGCGVEPEPGGTAGTTTSGDAMTTVTTEVSASSTISASSTSAETTNGVTSSSDAESSSSGGPAGPEICRTAMTEAECEAASDECHWSEAYRVIDLATCTLEPAPDLQCWARYVEPTNCALGEPGVCTPMGVHPRYREVDGQLQLLEYECTVGPEDLESDAPSWEVCGSDEFEPVPPVCYCMCGGPFE